MPSFTIPDLNQFSGDEHRYLHFFRQMIYTEGVHYMMANGAGWLVDAVASYQPDKRLRGNSRLQEFQLWRLEKKGKSGAVLTCRGDSGEKAVITQEIELTDFPFDASGVYEWYVCPNPIIVQGVDRVMPCMLLKNEY